MILKKASYKAVKYACLKFHYAKSVPVNCFGYSVFNKKNEWCGVVLFASGANNKIGMEYGLHQGAVFELVRMALNGKQSITSAVLSRSLKLLKKSLPLCELVVSYADIDQDHKGIIYQAANWIYTGNIKSNKFYLVNGEKIHSRTLFKKGIARIELARSIDPNAKEIISKGKENTYTHYQKI